MNKKTIRIIFLGSVLWTGASGGLAYAADTENAPIVHDWPCPAMPDRKPAWFRSRLQDTRPRNQPNEIINGVTRTLGSSQRPSAGRMPNTVHLALSGGK